MFGAPTNLPAPYRLSVNTDTNGRLMAPTNFLITNIVAGTNLVIEWSNNWIRVSAASVAAGTFGLTNATDVSDDFAGIANGDLLTWNSGAGVWTNAQPAALVAKSIMTNGAFISTSMTNLNLIAGSNTFLMATNVSGDVSIKINSIGSATGTGSSITTNGALVVALTTNINFVVGTNIHLLTTNTSGNVSVGLNVDSYAITNGIFQSGTNWVTNWVAWLNPFSVGSDAWLIYAGAGECYEMISIRRATNDVITNAVVRWCDGTYGEFICTSNNLTYGAVDSYTISYTNNGKVINQSAVIRDGDGQVTNKPAITITGGSGGGLVGSFGGTGLIDVFTNGASVTTEATNVDFFAGPNVTIYGTNVTGHAYITISSTGGGGGTNNFSSVMTNGAVVVNSATNLNLLAGANVTMLATNNSGSVSVIISSSGGGGSMSVMSNSALVVATATNLNIITGTNMFLLTTNTSGDVSVKLNVDPYSITNGLAALSYVNGLSNLHYVTFGGIWTNAMNSAMTVSTNFSLALSNLHYQTFGGVWTNAMNSAMTTSTNYANAATNTVFGQSGSIATNYVNSSSNLHYQASGTVWTNAVVSSTNAGVIAKTNWVLSLGLTNLTKDVASTFSGLSDGQVLKWSSANKTWTNQTDSTGVGGSGGSVMLDGSVLSSAGTNLNIVTGTNILVLATNVNDDVSFQFNWNPAITNNLAATNYGGFAFTMQTSTNFSLSLSNLAYGTSGSEWTNYANSVSNSVYGTAGSDSTNYANAVSNSVYGTSGSAATNYANAVSNSVYGTTGSAATNYANTVTNSFTPTNSAWFAMASATNLYQPGNANLTNYAGFPTSFWARADATNQLKTEILQASTNFTVAATNGFVGPSITNGLAGKTYAESLTNNFAATNSAWFAMASVTNQMLTKTNGISTQISFATANAVPIAFGATGTGATNVFDVNCVFSERAINMTNNVLFTNVINNPPAAGNTTFVGYNLTNSTADTLKLFFASAYKKWCFASVTNIASGKTARISFQVFDGGTEAAYSYIVEQ